jgi:hypothetical protein
MIGQPLPWHRCRTRSQAVYVDLNSSCSSSNCCLVGTDAAEDWLLKGTLLVTVTKLVEVQLLNSTAHVPALTLRDR